MPTVPMPLLEFKTSLMPCALTDISIICEPTLVAI